MTGMETKRAGCKCIANAYTVCVSYAFMTYACQLCWTFLYWLGHHSRAAVVAHSWRIVNHCQTIDVDKLSSCSRFSDSVVGFTGHKTQPTASKYISACRLIVLKPTIIIYYYCYFLTLLVKTPRFKSKVKNIVIVIIVVVVVVVTVMQIKGNIYVIKPWRIEGWVELGTVGSWLHTKIVSLPADSHSFK